MENKNICGIYKITSPTGRVYIGESSNIEERFKVYLYSKCKEQPKIYNSLKKYGWSNHIFEVIEECSLDNLLCRERYWQDFYDATGKNGLNCVLTECGESKKEISIDTKQKISSTLKGKFLGEKHPNYGKSITNKQKEAISKANKGRKWSEELKDRRKEYLIDNHPKSKLVLNLETGIYYKTAKEAAYAHNINYSTLRDYLRGRCPNKSYLIYC